ncbi:radical SAM protein [Candidatus Fermentibacteria bacterium]|nr:radical SAM protein [Candidatus Fermentibacteria bacterium]
MGSGARYRTLGARGLARRAEALEAFQSPCVLCPRHCGARRDQGEVGFCGIGTTAVVASWGLHFGEESVLVGQGGSGTVFLAGCNLGCVFCQNSSISHLRQGQGTGPDGLARIMVALQEKGAENINWVTPTHLVPQLVHALALAVGRGLTIPLVYNCGGYESIEALILLDGIVDIYLPDAKFIDEAVAKRLCNAPDYFARACRALRMMYRQVGGLRCDSRGVATGGVLVRHLVMSSGISGDDGWARALAHLTDGAGSVNVMGQYRPAYHADRIAAIGRRPTAGEVDDARQVFLHRGLHLVD